ncbi:hypothetical protein Acsp06_47920 [Actinomycetospora sp. NBRC 106375]|nr:hypothetical protein Acsp06_47920 [Actinomycetospora sp. NBRC 106375]
MDGHQDLAVPGLAEVAVDQREVVGLGHAVGAADEVDLAGGDGRGAHAARLPTRRGGDAVTRVALDLSHGDSPPTV